MNKLLRSVVGLTVLGVLLLPVLLYVAQFGGQLSPDHSRWGEFGSAMSGVYTPMLAIATLAVLIMQVRLQAEMHRYQRDHAFISQTRADIEFYVQRLHAALAATVPSGQSLRDVLQAEFEPSSTAELDSERLRSLAEEVDAGFPQVLNLTYAVQAILAGLSATEQWARGASYMSAIQKLIAVLSFETCVGIEHLERARNGPRVGFRYHFSPLLKRSA